MDYRAIFWFFLAILCGYLGVVIEHDSFNIFIAIAVVVISFGAVCIFVRSKPAQLFFFVVLTVCLCQGAVTAKAYLAQPDKAVQENPTGSLFGDLAYVARETPKNFKELKLAWDKTAVDDYSGFDHNKKLNYRLLTLGFCVPVALIWLTFRRNLVPRPVRK